MPTPPNTLNTSIAGWSFLALGLAILAWAAMFDPTIEVGPSYDRQKLLNQQLLNLQLVIAISGGAFTIVGAILLAAVAVIRGLSPAPRIMRIEAPANTADPATPPTALPAAEPQSDRAQGIVMVALGAAAILFTIMAASGLSVASSEPETPAPPAPVKPYFP